MTTYFPIAQPAELDSKFSLPVSSLIPSDTSVFLVPLYSAKECPEAARFDIATYLTARTPGQFFVPVYSSPAYAMTRVRPVAAIVTSAGS